MVMWSIGDDMRNIDGKFSTDGTKIFNAVSGEEIHEDEPLFLLRARDVHALQALRQYLHDVRMDCNDLHVEGTLKAIGKFEKFKHDNPERMKEPGVTRHLKL